MNAPDGNGVSPKLEWTHVPNGTVSFTLILHDPDVALQRNPDDVLHWMTFNIPGSAHELQEALPATAEMPDGAIQAKNLRGNVGYMGPGAPAVGPNHHYTFELFALDTKLDLGPNATRAEVLNAMKGRNVAGDTDRTGPRTSTGSRPYCEAPVPYAPPRLFRT